MDRLARVRPPSLPSSVEQQRYTAAMKQSRADARTEVPHPQAVSRKAGGFDWQPPSKPPRPTYETGKRPRAVEVLPRTSVLTEAWVIDKERRVITTLSRVRYTSEGREYLEPPGTASSGSAKEPAAVKRRPARSDPKIEAARAQQLKEEGYEKPKKKKAAAAAAVAQAAGNSTSTGNAHASSSSSKAAGKRVWKEPLGTGGPGGVLSADVQTLHVMEDGTVADRPKGGPQLVSWAWTDESVAADCFDFFGFEMFRAAPPLSLTSTCCLLPKFLEGSWVFSEQYSSKSKVHVKVDAQTQERKVSASATGQPWHKLPDSSLVPITTTIKEKAFVGDCVSTTADGAVVVVEYGVPAQTDGSRLSFSFKNTRVKEVVSIVKVTGGAYKLEFRAEKHTVEFCPGSDPAEAGKAFSKHKPGRTKVALKVDGAGKTGGGTRHVQCLVKGGGAVWHQVHGETGDVPLSSTDLGYNEVASCTAGGRTAVRYDYAGAFQPAHKKDEQAVMVVQYGDAVLVGLQPEPSSVTPDRVRATSGPYTASGQATSSTTVQPAVGHCVSAAGLPLPTGEPRALDSESACCVVTIALSASKSNSLAVTLNEEATVDDVRRAIYQKTGTIPIQLVSGTGVKARRLDGEQKIGTVSVSSATGERRLHMEGVMRKVQWVGDVPEPDEDTGCVKDLMLRAVDGDVDGMVVLRPPMSAKEKLLGTKFKFPAFLNSKIQGTDHADSFALFLNPRGRPRRLWEFDNPDIRLTFAEIDPVRHGVVRLSDGTEFFNPRAPSSEVIIHRIEAGVVELEGGHRFANPFVKKKAQQPKPKPPATAGSAGVASKAAAGQAALKSGQQAAGTQVRANSRSSSARPAKPLQRQEQEFSPSQGRVRRSSVADGGEGCSLGVPLFRKKDEGGKSSSSAKGKLVTMEKVLTQTERSQLPVEAYAITFRGHTFVLSVPKSWHSAAFTPQHVGKGLEVNYDSCSVRLTLFDTLHQVKWLGRKPTAAATAAAGGTPVTIKSVDPAIGGLVALSDGNTFANPANAKRCLGLGADSRKAQDVARTRTLPEAWEPDQRSSFGFRLGQPKTQAWKSAGAAGGAGGVIAQTSVAAKVCLSRVATAAVVPLHPNDSFTTVKSVEAEVGGTVLLGNGMLFANPPVLASGERKVRGCPRQQQMTGGNPEQVAAAAAAAAVVAGGAKGFNSSAVRFVPKLKQREYIAPAPAPHPSDVEPALSVEEQLAAAREQARAFFAQNCLDELAEFKKHLKAVGRHKKPAVATIQRGVRSYWARCTAAENRGTLQGDVGIHEP